MFVFEFIHLVEPRTVHCIRCNDTNNVHWTSYIIVSKSASDSMSFVYSRLKNIAHNWSVRWWRWCGRVSDSIASRTTHSIRYDRVIMTNKCKFLWSKWKFKKFKEKCQLVSQSKTFSMEISPTIDTKTTRTSTRTMDLRKNVMHIIRLRSVFGKNLQRPSISYKIKCA